MDESLQDLENELKRLSPRRPSSALLGALERELGPAPATAQARPPYRAATTWRSWKWAGWSLAGAMAALLAVAAVYFVRRPAAEPVVGEPAELVQVQPAAPAPVADAASRNRYQPVRATSVLYDMEEGGSTTLPDQSEGRQVRYRYVDTYTWRNPATNASLRWSVPREEVRLVKARLD